MAPKKKAVNCNLPPAPRVEVFPSINQLIEIWSDTHKVILECRVLKMDKKRSESSIIAENVESKQFVNYDLNNECWRLLADTPAGIFSTSWVKPGQTKEMTKHSDDDSSDSSIAVSSRTRGRSASRTRRRSASRTRERSASRTRGRSTSRTPRKSSSPNRPRTRSVSRSRRRSATTDDSNIPVDDIDNRNRSVTFQDTNEEGSQHDESSDTSMTLRSRSRKDSKRKK